MNKETFMKLLQSSAPTKKPPHGVVDWEKVYKEAVAAGMPFTSKTFQETIVKNAVNAGRTKAKLHEWADAKPPKVARLWAKTQYIWCFDKEVIATYAKVK